MELTGLTGDTEYEVRLRAMNSQGWSQLSNPFQFRTAGTWIELSNPFQSEQKVLVLGGSSATYPRNRMLEFQ